MVERTAGRMKGVEVEDFASASLVGFVRASLARRRLDVADAQPPAPGALIALDAKRGLLRRIAEDHGLGTVHAIGTDIRHAPFDPILHMLLAAPTGADLIGRWQRLERYVHSRHRVRTERAGSRDLVLAHVSERGEPPDPAEDLLVAGLLVGLLDKRGCGPVDLILVQEDGTEIAPARIATTGGPVQTHRWRLRWRAEPTSPTPTVPLGAAQASARGSTARVLARLAEDPAGPWSLQGLADDLGLAERTLQRRLAADGLSLSTAIAEARVQEASRLLTETQTPIGLVGLLAGYTDPPHFSRAFRKRLGFTPSEYRKIKAKPTRAGAR
ncbi:helix-turn-helix transcriptional regulator [Salinarimonas chemoclinalis]|uniref:helix-turn-helix transcriptional regulator n=1 Tax=Salinarimonas chemoclinalis TaxID=3241599 RepID=UPI0035585F46